MDANEVSKLLLLILNCFTLILIVDYSNHSVPNYWMLLMYPKYYSVLVLE